LAHHGTSSQKLGCTLQGGYDHMKTEWWKYIISIGITMMTFFTGLGVNKLNTMSDKIDALVITATINREK
jgi:hypothetical protein